MRPLLLDEGAFSSLVGPMRDLGLDVWTPGDQGAPPKGSPDEANCAWCAKKGAILVTTDRGKKDRTIHGALAKHGVGALFMHNDLRAAPRHKVLLAVLRAEEAIEDHASRRTRIRHRLTPTGKLRPWGK